MIYNRIRTGKREADPFSYSIGLDGNRHILMGFRTFVYVRRHYTSSPSQQESLGLFLGLG